MSESPIADVWHFPALEEADHIDAANNWWRLMRPEDRWLSEKQYLAAKRWADLFIVFLTWPLFLPVLLVCALLIKIESPGGPILFKQERTGKHGRRFGMYKLRTMVPNAELLKKDLRHLNELQWPDFKITDDPRVTRIGRLLRKTSLDELPQILNVLKGQMSLVGPRPTSFSAKTYSLWQTERLDVAAGITGLWQIVARGSADFDTRMRLDIAYIERRCLWLDIQILVRTFTSLLKQRGTY